MSRTIVTRAAGDIGSEIARTLVARGCDAPNMPTYSASKDAVIGLTRSAAKASQMIRMIPLSRYDSAEEVAQGAASMVSDAASSLTGVNLEVSGGSA